MSLLLDVIAGIAVRVRETIKIHVRVWHGAFLDKTVVRVIVQQTNKNNGHVITAKATHLAIGS